MLIWLKLTFQLFTASATCHFAEQKIYHPLAFSSRWVYGVDNILLLTNNYNPEISIAKSSVYSCGFHSQQTFYPSKQVIHARNHLRFLTEFASFLPIILFDSRDKVGSKGTGRQGMSIALTEYFTWPRDWAINMLQVFYCISSSQLLHPYLKLRKLVLRDIKYLFKIIQTVSGKSGIWTQVFPDPKVHDWLP